MGTYTNIRTEQKLGPPLSKCFQSFVNGPDIDGESCELNQVQSTLNLDLSAFLTTNYSGMWDESEFDFIEDESEREKMLEKQREDDDNWILIQDFNNLIDKLIDGVEKNKLSDIRHEYDWWQGYFLNSVTDHKDSFKQDLITIKAFLENAKAEGHCSVAFYSE
ncbi:hypothetical protein [Tenacibaculum ovolyticum]|uniref:hypothetical protein n=1 Tax=Tenacibaculum ovolyticum TaxID=104270 RepID=UPI0007EE0B78|nr:hypothetical protein [Tenacibaculum ovolyticum]